MLKIVQKREKMQKKSQKSLKWRGKKQKIAQL